MQQKATDKTKEGQTVTQEEKALVASWKKRIEETKDSEEYKTYHQEIAKRRRYVKGLKGISGEGRVRTNLVYSTIAASLPHIYAKNPEIAVTPAATVDQKQFPAIKGLARTIEVVLGRHLTDANLKKRGKAAVRSAQTTNIGWLKVMYQRDIKTDPIVMGRIQDIQDNLQRIEYLMEKCEDDTAMSEHERYQAELTQQINVLSAQVEVVRAEGLVIDRVKSEDLLLPIKVCEFDDYVDSPWMAQRIWYRDEEYEAQFGCKHEKLIPYGKPDSQTMDDKKAKYFAVWEIWDKESNTVYTWGEGAEQWARQPYSPTKLGERWYPYFGLAFNPIDGCFLPMSDVELLEKLQDEYEETREEYAEVRKANKPHYLADADTSEKDVVKKTIAGVGEVIIVDSNGKPLREKFVAAEMLPVKPENYNTDQIRFDMEYVYGMGDAAHGSVGKAKTATEAEILQGALTSRTSERQDAVEDWLREVAIYATEILLQELTMQQVQRIAGPNAIWPELNKQDIFDLVSVEIRSGTSGKPNKAREQEQWLKFLPQFTEMISQIADLRSNGNYEIADAMIKVARETIRRFDERIDIDDFLPSGNDGQDAAKQAQKNAALQQQTAFDLQNRQAEADINKTESETIRNNVQAGIDLHDAITGVNQPGDNYGPH